VYDLEASMPGFRTSKNRVQLASTESVNGTIRLQIGSVRESIVVVVDPPSPLAPRVSQAPANPTTAADHFDVAQMYYAQGRFADAEAMTSRALELLRSAIPESLPAGPPVDTTGAVRVGGDIREPRKIRDAKPMYPADAIAAGVQGTVNLEAVIARDGTVRDAHILRGVRMLDEAALGAVRQWLFTPTLLNSVPVDVIMNVTISFTTR